MVLLATDVALLERVAAHAIVSNVMSMLWREGRVEGGNIGEIPGDNFFDLFLLFP